MVRFRDRTGLPGPRGWSDGTFPAGQDEHPVTSVSWYEAAAYAAYRGKDRSAEVAAYLASPRRIAFNEQGIFRHYPELDLG